MIKKILATLAAILMILFPNPALTASGVTLLIYTWFPQVFGKK